MTREDVIQRIIDAKGASRYMEIGVYQGTTFQKIRCRHKIAVDPQFRIPFRGRLRYFFRNLGSRYWQMTSNDFFARYKTKTKFDVIFIDGLHNYEQSLIDVEKSIALLAQNGVIVMHDCSPVTDSAATPADSWEHAQSMNLPGWTGEWNGDVWKTIVHLRSTRNDLRVCVLDCDYGLGLVTRAAPRSMLNVPLRNIKALTYQDLKTHRKEWLDLKPEAFLAEFLKSVV